MDTIDVEENKREEFKKILYQIALQEIDINKKEYDLIIEKLEKLYWNEDKGDNTGFRHFYSDIFVVLAEIQNEQPAKGSVDILGNNLGIIRTEYQKNNNKDKNKKPIDISENLKKLFDHVSLDIARMTYSDAGDNRVSNSEAVKKIHLEIDELKNDLKESEKKVEVEEKKLDSMQKEYIAILGIFAAIVIAFVGQMTFSMSVLANAYRLGDIFTIIAVVAMIGLAFINVLFSLFYFVGKLVKDDGIISLKAWIALNIIVGVIITLMIGMHFLIESHLMDVILLKIKNVF